MRMGNRLLKRRMILLPAAGSDLEGWLLGRECWLLASDVVEATEGGKGVESSGHVGNGVPQAGGEDAEDSNLGVAKN